MRIPGVVYSRLWKGQRKMCDVCDVWCVHLKYIAKVSWSACGQKLTNASYWLLAIGCWMHGKSVAGYWVLVAGYRLLVSGCWLSVAGYGLLTTSCWLLAIGFWLLVAECWLLAFSFWLLATGSWLLVTGSWMLVTGFWYTVTSHRLLVWLSVLLVELSFLKIPEAAI